MTESNREYDVAVLGAGPAGIAATHRLKAAGLNVLMVEARDRIGGRSHTQTLGPKFGLDLGCEWLHSADINPWTRIAKELGFTLDMHLPDWGSRVAWHQGQDAQREWEKTQAAYYERLDRAAEEPQDRSAASLLEPGNKWNPLLGAISNWANGAEIENVSVKDYGRYDPTNVNWRVLEGYGALIARYGQDLPVALNTIVELIDHGSTPLRIVTNHGDIRARAVIVTLPASILAQEAVKFCPVLPAKVTAAAGLPLGNVNKLFLRLSGEAKAIDKEGDHHFIGAVDRVKTASYQIRPHGWPVVMGFFGGELSAELEKAGLAAFADFGINELAGIFGNDIKPHLSPLIASQWGLEPFSRGSYSFALPGHAGAREALATPVGDRLFFAGEACSLPHFGTAHGAFLTAVTAAEAAIKALRAGR